MISIGFFAYKNPDFVMKKSKNEASLLRKETKENQLLNASELETVPETPQQTVTFGEQLKAILSNTLFLFLALGFAALLFTFVGFGFWGIDFCEEYYGTNPTIASFAFGGVSLIGGLFWTILGGVIHGRIIKSHMQERAEGKITEEKLKWYKAESASRICFWSIFVSFCFCIVAGMSPNFILFIVFYGLGIFCLITSFGVLYIAIFSSWEENLRNQSLAIA